MRPEGKPPVIAPHRLGQMLIAALGLEGRTVLKIEMSFEPSEPGLVIVTEAMTEPAAKAFCELVKREFWLLPKKDAGSEQGPTA